LFASSSARRSVFSDGGKSSAWIRCPIWTVTTITTSTADIAANAKTALEIIRRIQKTKNQRYSEQYLKILQNPVQSNVPIRRQQPGALLQGSEGLCRWRSIS
jgi:hypothetical protein